MRSGWLRHVRTIYHGHTPYDYQLLCKVAKSVLCNFQVVFCVGMVLALQTLLLDDIPPSADTEHGRETGDELYHWRDRIGVNYSDYVASVVYRLVVQHEESAVKLCDKTAFDIHDQAGMPLRQVPLMKVIAHQQGKPKVVTWGSFYWHGLTLITVWINNYINLKCEMELLIHSQTSTVQPLKFGNG